MWWQRTKKSSPTKTNKKNRMMKIRTRTLKIFWMLRPFLSTTSSRRKTPRLASWQSWSTRKTSPFYWIIPFCTTSWACMILIKRPCSLPERSTCRLSWTLLFVKPITTQLWTPSWSNWSSVMVKRARKQRGKLKFRTLTSRTSRRVTCITWKFRNTTLDASTPSSLTT